MHRACHCRSYREPAPSSLAISRRRASDPTFWYSASRPRRHRLRCWSTACRSRPGENQMVCAEAGIDHRHLFGAGSYTASWRPELSTGVSFAEMRLDPALQNAGLSLARMRDVYHSRPCSSNIGLWTVVWLSQMALRPRTVEAASGWRLSRRVRVAVRNLHMADRVVHGIEHRKIVAAFLRRAVDQPVGVQMGLRLSVEISSCR